MTTTSTPPDDEVRGQSSTANAPATGRKRPVLWMIATGIAVLAAIGLGIWAVNVHSDLEEQTAATEAAEAQAAAQAEAAAAAAAEIEKIDASNEVYVVSNEDVAQVESDVAAAEEAVAQANAAAVEASGAVSAAQDEAATLRAELEQARAERDLARAEREQARAEREQARICARGSLGALSALGTGDAEGSSQLETVSSACAASVPE